MGSAGSLTTSMPSGTDPPSAGWPDSAPTRPRGSIRDIDRRVVAGHFDQVDLEGDGRWTWRWAGRDGAGRGRGGEPARAPADRTSHPSPRRRAPRRRSVRRRPGAARGRTARRRTDRAPWGRGEATQRVAAAGMRASVRKGRIDRPLRNAHVSSVNHTAMRRSVSSKVVMPSAPSTRRSVCRRRARPGMPVSRNAGESRPSRPGCPARRRSRATIGLPHGGGSGSPGDRA